HPPATTYPFLFFIYFYPPHRDLHSFPTRRSSDLEPCGNAKRRRSLPPHQASTRSQDGFRYTRAPSGPDSYVTVLRSVPTMRMSRDRKSTRLNSSHSQISYAVFCLKKKKKKKTIRV